MNLLFIGCNHMREIGLHSYIYNKYKNGLFIEPLNGAYKELLTHLENFNINHHTDFKGLNKLITNKEREEHCFYVTENNVSSSIFHPNNEKHSNIDWLKTREKIYIESTRMKSVLIEEKWTNLRFDAVIDVQGAELEVLKSFDDYIDNIDNLRVEVSKRDLYKGAVLFEEINCFLLDRGFKSHPLAITPDHGDMLYYR